MIIWGIMISRDFSSHLVKTKLLSIKTSGSVDTDKQLTVPVKTMELDKAAVLSHHFFLNIYLNDIFKKDTKFYCGLDKVFTTI